MNAYSGGVSGSAAGPREAVPGTVVAGEGTVCEVESVGEERAVKAEGVQGAGDRSHTREEFTQGTKLC